ncbi:unnamed protein product, partial [Dibothriocephalus latus]
MLSLRHHHLSSSILVILVFCLRVNLVFGGKCALDYNSADITGTCYRIIPTPKDFCSAANYCLEESRRLKHRVSLPVVGITGLLFSFNRPTQSWLGAATVATTTTTTGEGGVSPNLSVQLIFPRARGTPLPGHIAKQLPATSSAVGQCLVGDDALRFQLVDCGVQLPF